VILPSFAADAGRAFEAAAQAEEAGIDGVFAYDHLWPMGEPGRPALAPFPLLGAIAARSHRVAIGTLMARVGLSPDDVLADQLMTLDDLSGGRVVAGLGTGDAKSAKENAAYGIEIDPAEQRRDRLRALAEQCVGAGITTWIGGGSDATNDIARSTGAVLNLWSVPAQRVRQAAMSGVEVTWAGSLPKRGGTTHSQIDIEASATLLASMAEAGSTWAVVNWPGSIQPVLDVVLLVGRARDRAADE